MHFNVTRLLPILLVMGACSTPRYVARVPHMAVPMSSGQPMSTQFELTGGASAVKDLRKPTTEDPELSMEVPSTQLHASARFRISETTYAGMIYEQGLSAGSHKLNTSGGAVGARDVLGTGLFFGGSLPMAPQFNLGLHGEIIRWSLPYVELVNGSVTESGREGVSTLGFAVTPSYRSGPTTVFGTAFVRNHPMSTIGIDLDDGGVTAGPPNFTIAAGVEYALSPIVSATAIINQDLSRDPVSYGPSLQLAVTGKLGK